MGGKNPAPLKFDTKLSEATFSDVFFSNFEKCQQEAADDVIFGLDVEHVGVDVRAKLGDSMSNSS